MLRGFLIGLVVATTAAAMAQEKGDQPGRPQAEPAEQTQDQTPKTGDEKASQDEKPATAPPTSGRTGRDSGAPGESLDRIAQRLTSPLDLAPEQKAQVDRIVAEHNQQRAELRKLVAEMIRAPKTEPEKFEQLRNRVVEMQTKMRDPVAWLTQDIEKVLDPGQAERLRALRDQMAHGGRATQRNDRDLVRELRATLELTPEQSAQFDEMLFQGGDAHGEHAHGGGALPAEELQPLLEELKQAREARDRERIAEIQKKLAGMQGNQPIDWDDFTTRLAAILTPEQVEKLEAFEVRLASGEDNAAIGEIRDIFRAARRVGLTAEQTTKIRELQKLVRRKHGRLGVSDDAERKKVVDELKGQLKELLNEQQYQRFEFNLQKLQKRGK